MSLNLDIVKPYKFHLQSGAKRTLRLLGTKPGDRGTVFIVEADGKRGEYSSLQEAIGEPYTKVEPAEQL